MTTIVKRCRGEKKRGIRAIDGFRKKLMIPDSEIDPYFYEHHKEKIKFDKNGRECILFRIDVYFTEYFLAVEIDEQNHEGRDLVLKKKDKRHQKKNLVVNLFRINTSDAKRAYDTDYQVSKIQTFINEFNKT